MDGPATSRIAGVAAGGEEAAFPELLGFCARGEALVAELLLLSDRLPPEFRDRRFDPVLFDFRYFQSPGNYETSIEGNIELEALEDQLRESCGPYMQRFFSLVNGAVIYYGELLSYLNDLQDGLYVHYTFDGVLESNGGCQLLTESITLFGCFLLLLECRIGGFLRERLLVGYLRYERCFSFPNLEQICSLCRIHKAIPGSSSNPGSSLVSSYIISIQKPEEIFARFPFPDSVVDAVISYLRSGDIYSNIRFYPDPQHRTTALSLQAGHLYVLLVYSPKYLHDGLVMREIVDRFFRDNWVVPIFLHFSVDLLVSWDAYKEAKSSLICCLSPSFVHDHSLHHYTKAPRMLSDLDIYDCAINNDYILDNSQGLLSFIRECNCTLRWLLLHRMSNDKRAKETSISIELSQQVNEESLLRLLMKTAKLEFGVKKLYVELLGTRETMWHEKRHDASECIKDLSQNYFGTWASSCKFKNKSLKDWFESLLSEVNSLSYTATGSSGRIIHRVISTMKDVEQLHQIKESLQVKHGLSKVQKNLHDMIKILNLNQEAMCIFSVITDATYAWGLFTKFEELLKKKIKQDPSETLSLHTVFLKFQSLLHAPLQRIRQCESPDVHCVTSYYSSKYADRIFAVLDIIPTILLDISFSVDNLQSEQPVLLLNRINKEAFEDFMQLDRQLYQARQAAKLSTFSEGILNMSRNFSGLLDLNLRAWLEERIRKDLASQLDRMLKSLSIPVYVRAGDIESNLSSLSSFMFSRMQMMEFLQGILHIDGNRIWEDTFTSVLEKCAKAELAELMSCIQKSGLVLKNLSKFNNFFGYLLHHIIHLTDPSQSMFIEAMMGWFDAAGNELLGLHFFNVLESCVGQVGLVCLDSLIHMLVKDRIKHTVKDLHVLFDATYQEELYKLDELLGPPMSIPLTGWSSYKQMMKTFQALWGPLVEKLATIGQLQLVRHLISFKLRATCKTKANAVTSAVEVLASASSRTERFEGTQEDPAIGMFLHALNEQRKNCGLVSPLQAIYISEDPPMFLGRFLSLFSISQLSSYVLDVHLGSLTSPLKKSITDFSSVIIGLGTLLRQFDPFYMTQYIQFMVQYVRTAEAAFDATDETHKGSAHTSEAPKAVFWLLSLCNYMDVSKNLVELCVPSAVLAVLQS